MKRNSKRDDNSTLLLVAGAVALFFLLRKKQKTPIIEAGPISDPGWNPYDEGQEYLDAWRRQSEGGGGGGVLELLPADRVVPDTFDYYQEIRGDVLNGPGRSYGKIPTVI